MITLQQETIHIVSPNGMDMIWFHWPMNASAVTICWQQGKTGHPLSRLGTPEEANEWLYYLLFDRGWN